MIMGFLSKLAISQSFDDYRYLSENTVKSENYEVVKLINGDIDAVLHIKGTNTMRIKPKPAPRVGSIDKGNMTGKASPPHTMLSTYSPHKRDRVFLFPNRCGAPSIRHSPN